MNLHTPHYLIWASFQTQQLGMLLCPFYRWRYKGLERLSNCQCQRAWQCKSWDLKLDLAVSRLSPSSHPQCNFAVLLHFFNLFFYWIFHYYLSPVISPPRHSHHTVVHVHESFFLLAHSSTPSLHPTPPELSACSVSLSLFGLLDQFLHSILHMCEITWYLSFSDWLISLSIMFSRSIDAVTKGKIFFFAASFTITKRRKQPKCPSVFKPTMGHWHTGMLLGCKRGLALNPTWHCLLTLSWGLAHGPHRGQLHC